MSQGEIVARRRKWRPEEKAALLAEVEAEGGRVSVVARRHGISGSLLYNWRSAWKAAASMRSPYAVEFVPLGVVGRAGNGAPAMPSAPEHAASPDKPRRERLIEIELPNGIRVRVEAGVDETALSRILAVVKDSA
jgi:transposase